MIWEIGGVRLYGSREDIPATGPVLVVREFDPGEMALREQVTASPSGDEVTFGREYQTPPTWTFDIVALSEDPAEVAEMVAGLARAWRPATLRDPATVVEMAVTANGRDQVVFGRPARFVPDSGAVPGAGSVLATFRLADPMMYDAAPRFVELGLLAGGGGSVVLPRVLPWQLGQVAGTRQGVITVTGDAPVPMTVSFYGPVTGTAAGFWARGDGWRIDLNTTLAFDQCVSVDTRAHTVTRSDGRSLVSAASGRFLSARLAPGTQEIGWGATDSTATARMVLTWREATHTLGSAHDVF